ncbi:hypothetical protein ACJJI5_12410 [Microbulbifer sp. EKSA008]|uniref:hypothetical protein n=1 Tax=unclassified Microbulbifer TaxID=2619833 RepID=UPI0040395B8A
MDSVITFPVVCFLNGKITVHTKSSFKALGARFLDEQTFVTLENRRSKAKDGWILDSSGKFVPLSHSGNLREWARPISFLWNAVLTKYQANIEGAVKVGFVLKDLDSMSKSSPGKLGMDFKRFLSKYEPDQYITSDMLKEWPL